MLTQEQIKSLTEKALKYSTFPECTVSVNETEQAYVRFANNGVTTSALTLDRAVTIVSTKDGRSGVARTSLLGDDALRAAVSNSEKLAAISPPNPENVPPLGPQKYPVIDNFDDATAAARGPQMVPHVKNIIDRAAKDKLVSAGFFSRTLGVEGFATKTGNSGFSRNVDCDLTTTVRTAAGDSSGWAGQNAVRIAEINGGELGDRAAAKCARWKSPVRLDPGKYKVVLEPTAVADLLGNVRFAFDARGAEEGRTFFSKKGGGTRLGEKIFPDYVTLRSDPFDKRFPSNPWSNGLLPAQARTWIDKGVVRNLAYNRYWALKTKQEPVEFPGSLILEGGESSLADLIKATDRGLLVTRFWYLRVLNPQTLQLTGLTRDGLFLIENGEVTKPVVNFRFNESPFRLLTSIQKMGRAVRAPRSEQGSVVVPPVLAADFNFTSISDAV
ncbi:MAG: TldD/PmbA family protein [Bryobacterales bacterium]|nr:TldD/PmbA family protein [Bryobacterales bacterium]